MSAAEPANETIVQPITSEDGNANVLGILEDEQDGALLGKLVEDALRVQERELTETESNDMQDLPQLPDEVDDASLPVNGHNELTAEKHVTSQPQPTDSAAVPEDEGNTLRNISGMNGQYQDVAGSGEAVPAKESSIGEDNVGQRTPDTAVPEKKTMHVADASADRRILNEMELQSDEVELEDDPATLEVATSVSVTDLDTGLPEQLPEGPSPEGNTITDTDVLSGDAAENMLGLPVESESKLAVFDTMPEDAAMQIPNSQVDDYGPILAVPEAPYAPTESSEIIQKPQNEAGFATNDETAAAQNAGELQNQPDQAIVEHPVDENLVAGEAPIQVPVEGPTETLSWTNVSDVSGTPGTVQHENTEPAAPLQVDVNSISTDSEYQGNRQPDQAKTEAETTPAAVVDPEVAGNAESDSISIGNEPSFVGDVSQVELDQPNVDAELSTEPDDMPTATLDPSLGEDHPASTDLQSEGVPTLDDNSIKDVDQEDKPIPTEIQASPEESVPLDNTTGPEATTVDAESLTPEDESIISVGKEPESVPAVLVEHIAPQIEETPATSEVMVPESIEEPVTKENQMPVGQPTSDVPENTRETALEPEAPILHSEIQTTNFSHPANVDPAPVVDPPESKEYSLAVDTAVGEAPKNAVIAESLVVEVGEPHHANETETTRQEISDAPPLPTTDEQVAIVPDTEIATGDRVQPEVDFSVLQGDEKISSGSSLNYMGDAEVATGEDGSLAPGNSIIDPSAEAKMTPAALLSDVSEGQVDLGPFIENVPDNDQSAVTEQVSVIELALPAVEAHLAKGDSEGVGIDNGASTDTVAVDVEPSQNALGLDDDEMANQEPPDVTMPTTDNVESAPQTLVESVSSLERISIPTNTETPIENQVQIPEDIPDAQVAKVPHEEDPLDNKTEDVANIEKSAANDLVDTPLAIATGTDAESLLDIDKPITTAELPTVVPEIGADIPDDVKPTNGAEAEPSAVDNEEQLLTRQPLHTVEAVPEDNGIAEQNGEKAQAEAIFVDGDEKPSETKNYDLFEEKRSVSQHETVSSNGDSLVTTSVTASHIPETEMPVSDAAVEVANDLLVSEAGRVDMESNIDVQPLNDADKQEFITKTEEAATQDKPPITTEDVPSSVAVVGDTHAESIAVEERPSNTMELSSGAIPVQEIVKPEETEPESTQIEVALPKDDRPDTIVQACAESEPLALADDERSREESTTRELESVDKKPGEIYVETTETNSENGEVVTLPDLSHPGDPETKEPESLSHDVTFKSPGISEQTLGVLPADDDSHLAHDVHEAETINENEMRHSSGDPREMAPVLATNPSAAKGLATAEEHTNTPAIIDPNRDSLPESFPTFNGSTSIAESDPAVKSGLAKLDEVVSIPSAEIVYPRQPENEDFVPEANEPEVITPSPDTEIPVSTSVERPKSPRMPPYNVTVSKPVLSAEYADATKDVLQTSSEHPSEPLLMDQNVEVSSEGQGSINLPAKHLSQDGLDQGKPVAEVEDSMPVDALVVSDVDVERPKSPWTPSYSTTAQGQTASEHAQEGEISETIQASLSTNSRNLDSDNDDGYQVTVTPGPKEDSDSMGLKGTTAFSSLSSNVIDVQVMQDSVEISPEIASTDSLVDPRSQASVLANPNTANDLPAGEAQPESLSTPSYSVTVTGNMFSGAAQSNQIEEETFASDDHITESSIEIAPADIRYNAAMTKEYNDKPDGSFSTSVPARSQQQIFNETDEAADITPDATTKPAPHELTTSLSDDIHDPRPERPKSPWTPSYSVMRQGSPLLEGGALDSNQADRDEAVRLGETIIPSSNPPELKIAIEKLTTNIVTSEDVSFTTRDELASTVPPVLQASKPQPHDIPEACSRTDAKDSQIKITVISEALEQESSLQIGHAGEDKSDALESDGHPTVMNPAEGSILSEDVISGQGAVRSEQQNTELRSQSDPISYTSVRDERGKHTRPVPLRLVPVDGGGSTIVTSHNDTLSPTRARKRKSSTASSSFFPGGWLSSATSKAEEGRPSMEIASGVFTPSKSPIEVPLAVPPPTPVVPYEHTRGRSCIIM